MESVIIEADLKELDSMSFVWNEIRRLTLKAGIDNIKESLAECLDDLRVREAIYVPYGKIGYYKSKLPGKYHKLVKRIPKVEK